MPRPLFISHGAPDVLLRDTPAHRAMQALGAQATPDAYLVISAHWQAGDLQLISSAAPETIHDFRGFGAELEQVQYPAPGAPDLAHALAETLAENLSAHGLNLRLNARRGLDHGCWIPLALMRPAADIPVLQLSLPRQSDQDSIVLGQALRPLIKQNIQIIGSGALTHSLADSLGEDEDAAPAAFATAFRDALVPALERNDLDAASAWRLAPFARRNHPTPEHFRPLLVAMAAGGQPGHCLHTSWSRSALAMDIWAF